MNSVQIVEIKEDIKSRNNEQAKDIRREMKEKKIFFLNVMSSPGSGKTTLIINLIQRLKDDFTIGVIEADRSEERRVGTVCWPVCWWRGGAGG